MTTQNQIAEAPIRILVSAGEVSGDIAGAQLVTAIRRICQADFFGLGGHRMHAAGVRLHLDTNKLGTVGITEALANLPGLTEGFLRLRREVLGVRPHVALLIGNDVFNFFLARWLRRHGIPTVAFFPPQVWIWRALARFIAGSFNLILTSFPEEDQVYRAAGGSTRFVGHYLCDLLELSTSRDKCRARRAHSLCPDARVIALLPGSRDKEVKRLTPTLLRAAAKVLTKDPSIKFLLPVAEPCFQSFIEKEIERHSLEDRVIVTRNSYDAMRACDLALLASGTASLEAALLGIPMIVLYRVSSMTLMVVKLALQCGLLHSETVGLPNLILRKACVPELRQTGATVDQLAQLAWTMLTDQTHLADIQRQLGSVAKLLAAHDTLETAASLILEQASGRGRPFPREQKRAERESAAGSGA